MTLYKLLPAIALTLSLWGLSSAGAEAAKAEPEFAVGIAKLTARDPEGTRDVGFYLWYPTDSRKETWLLADNAALRGFKAIPNAEPAPGRHPLVLLSHGLNGNWRNQSWLAVSLARRGMIVAAPNHPGTTTRDRQSAETPKLWRRPEDLKRVLSHLLSAEPWRASADATRVAAIGHSMGGYSVMALAGARFDAGRFEPYCTANPMRADCRWYRDNGVGESKAALGRLQASLHDPRVKAVVSLDLGFTQALDPKSLAAIDIPVLVMGAGRDRPILPVATESRLLAKLLPTSRGRYREFPDATHFSFLQDCKPGAIALLEQAGEGDEVICLGGGGRSRKELHEGITRDIRAFLSESGF